KHSSKLWKERNRVARPHTLAPARNRSNRSVTRTRSVHNLVKAIDVHVHPVSRPSVGQTEREQQMKRYFRGEETPQDPESFYQYYKERDMMGVLLVTGPVADPPDGEPNHTDWSAELMTRYPDTFIGFGG